MDLLDNKCDLTALVVVGGDISIHIGQVGGDQE